MDESALDRIRQSLQEPKIKETKKKSPRRYWAAIMFFIILIGAGGMSPKGGDILAQMFGTMPEKPVQKDSSVIVKEAERLGVAEAKKSLPPSSWRRRKLNYLLSHGAGPGRAKDQTTTLPTTTKLFRVMAKTSLPGNVTKKKLNNRYRNISAKISDLKVNVEDSKAWAYFTQKYHSNSYRDYEYKLMEFKKEGHSWNIFRERSFNKKPYSWPM